MWNYIFSNKIFNSSENFLKTSEDISAFAFSFIKRGNTQPCLESEISKTHFDEGAEEEGGGVSRNCEAI